MDTEEFLEHHGVKGQKWGVRNEERLQRARRVARGSATSFDRQGFAAREVSGISLIRNHGIQGAAKSRVHELEARKARINKGKAHISDWLGLHGGDALFITGKDPKK